MKIGVCFKIVPDYEEVPLEEWSLPGGPDLAYVKKQYGCYDEAALETALCLKDSCMQSNIEVQTVAVTAGVSDGAVSESLLRGLFAAGFDDVVILPETDAFAPPQTAANLATWFQEQPVDVLFTGQSTGPSDSGLVPYYLADQLQMSVINGVTSAKWEEGLLIGRKTGEITSESPCVLIVGDSETPNLRLFPLKARMDAQKRSFIYAGAVREETEMNADVIIRPCAATDSDCVMLEKDAAQSAQFLIGKIREVQG